MGRKLRVLLTNDDGFSAPGIQHIYSELRDEFEVTVIAPEEEQSGIGHAFTYHKPLVVNEKRFQDSVGYSVAGTPADCVKFALSYLMDERPDSIVSGINNGGNTGIAGFYSGTVAAARESAFWQVTGVAFSCEGEDATKYMADYAEVSRKILLKILNGRKSGNRRDMVYYNVNFPSCRVNDCAGVKLTRQSLSFWNDIYTPVENDTGKVEYWLNGERKDVEEHNEYDTRAINDRYITITPLHIDNTAVDAFKSSSQFDDIL